MLPYLLSALYYLKLTGGGIRDVDIPRRDLKRGRIFAIVGTIYGVWMIISAGIVQFLITSILYAPGIWVYVKGRQEKNLEPFKPFEKNIAIILVVVAVVSIVLMSIGIVNPF